MRQFRYSIIGVIDGQEFSSRNNTREELKSLVQMIQSFGGWVVEFREEEVISRR